MSAWPGKYVIGLTGNIATGKSVVRKMLEHLGAYGIDADALAHRAMAQGSPGYQPIVETFGKWVLAADGQIDRAKLGRMVFSDPEALQSLENIVHPLVSQAIDILIRRSRQHVVVIEAIKLIESGLAGRCDSVWVTVANPQQQIRRLIQKRNLSEEMARQRMNAQSAQENKIAAAQIIIRNDSTFENTWLQVVAAWNKLLPEVAIEEPPAVKPPTGALVVIRARPKDAEEIAQLISSLSGGKRRVTRDEVMAAFGEKAFLLLQMDGRNLGIVGWRVENLVACTDDVFLEQSIPTADALRALMNEVEKTSRELQCEASLLFLPAEFSRQEATIRNLGYQVRTIETLGVRAWEEAAQESMPAGSMMLFKQLRQDRVLRPV